MVGGEYHGSSLRLGDVRVEVRGSRYRRYKKSQVMVKRRHKENQERKREKQNQESRREKDEE